MTTDLLFHERHGVFVYLILHSVRPLEYPSSSLLRSSNSSDSNSNFKKGGFLLHQGDLISVDRVRTYYPYHHNVGSRMSPLNNNDHDEPHKTSTRTSTSTTMMTTTNYLHLSDDSGWIPEHVHWVKRMAVESGLWTLYVDNCPHGQCLLHHPMDRPDADVVAIMGTQQNNQEDEEGTAPIILRYETMQKVYCDRKVVHPTTMVAFYRVQGIHKWLMDRRITLHPDKEGVPCSSCSASSSSSSLIVPNDYTTTRMLIDAMYVHTGVFCFQALETLRVRSRATTVDDEDTTAASTTTTPYYQVQKGSLVAIDLIKEEVEESESESGFINGPYLRLADGSGWLFVHKNRVPVMMQIPVRPGTWELKIVANSPMTLQRHPRMEVKEKEEEEALLLFGKESRRCRSQHLGPYPEHTFPPQALIQATHKVQVRLNRDYHPFDSSNQTIFHTDTLEQPYLCEFYLIHGTNGWLASRFDDPSRRRTLQVLTAKEEEEEEDPHHAAAISVSLLTAATTLTTTAATATARSNIHTWTMDFVRGVASTIPSIQEMRVGPSSVYNPVLMYRSSSMCDDGMRKVVYCGTQTVGILFDDEVKEDDNEDRNDDDDDHESDWIRRPAQWFRNCTPQELYEHLRRDAVEMMMLQESNSSSTFDGRKNLTKTEEEQEEDLRKELLRIDQDIARGETKRHTVYEKLRVFDEERFRKTAGVRQLMEERCKARTTTDSHSTVTEDYVNHTNSDSSTSIVVEDDGDEHVSIEVKNDLFDTLNIIEHLMLTRTDSSSSRTCGSTDSKSCDSAESCDSAVYTPRQGPEVNNSSLLPDSYYHRTVPTSSTYYPSTSSFSVHRSSQRRLVNWRNRSESPTQSTISKQNSITHQLIASSRRMEQLLQQSKSQIQWQDPYTTEEDDEEEEGDAELLGGSILNAGSFGHRFQDLLLPTYTNSPINPTKTRVPRVHFDDRRNYVEYSYGYEDYEEEDDYEDEEESYMSGSDLDDDDESSAIGSLICDSYSIEFV